MSTDIEQPAEEKASSAEFLRRLEGLEAQVRKLQMTVWFSLMFLAVVIAFPQIAPLAAILVGVFVGLWLLVNLIV